MRLRFHFPQLSSSSWILRKYVNVFFIWNVPCFRNSISEQCFKINFVVSTTSLLFKKIIWICKEFSFQTQTSLGAVASSVILLFSSLVSMGSSCRSSFNVLFSPLVGTTVASSFICNDDVTSSFDTTTGLLGVLVSSESLPLFSCSSAATVSGFVFGLSGFSSSACGMMLRSGGCCAVAAVCNSYNIK